MQKKTYGTKIKETHTENQRLRAQIESMKRELSEATERDEDQRDEISELVEMN